MEDELHINITLVAGVILICIILCVLFAFKLWDLPIRVNCWFCNNNDWVRFVQRNSWICQKCQQYNGFSSDGDYNKSLQTHLKNPVYFNQNRHSPRGSHNGLCHKCNTNQQLKVLQLANFKPMNEKNFDREVEAFSLHLDDVFKLCHECRRLVNKKLQTEKGHFLVKKKCPLKSKNSQSWIIFNSAKNSVRIILRGSAILLLICILVDIAMNAELFLSKKMVRMIKQHFSNMINALSNITLLNEDIISWINDLREKFSNVTVYISNLMPTNYVDLESIKNMVTNSPLGHISLAMALGWMTSTGLVLQGLLFLSELGLSLRYFINVAMWSFAYYISSKQDKYLHLFQLSCAIILIANTPLNGEEKTDTKKKSAVVSKKMKNLSSSSFSSAYNDVELTSDDSDPDISNERTSTPDYFKSKDTSPSRYFSAEAYQFPYHNNSLNSSFCSSQYDKTNTSTLKNYNPYLSGKHSTSGMSLWQKNVTAHNSDLDDSISTLNLGHKSCKSRDKSFVFSTKKYDGRNAFMPSPEPIIRRPVLSPSMFTNGTQQSWVAGGYWGVDSPRQIYNLHDTSRSSSQSSGFESLNSGYRAGSFPPSRDESIAGDYCKKSDNIFCDKSLYSSFSGNPSAFQNFPSQASTMRGSVASSRPLFFPHRVPSDCSTSPRSVYDSSKTSHSVPFDSLKNLNLLSPTYFNTDNDHSFKPLSTS